MIVPAIFSSIARMARHWEKRRSPVRTRGGRSSPIPAASRSLGEVRGPPVASTPAPERPQRFASRISDAPCKRSPEQEVDQETGS